MLKEKGINPRLFEEIKAKKNLSFQFKEKGKPFYYVSSLANKLHDYPPEDIIYHAYSMDNYREDLLHEVLKRLVPEKMRLLLSSPKVKGLCDKMEP
jgi:secreted Zn-dependent insulinase-like peptidase